MDSQVRDVFHFFSGGTWMQGSMECRYDTAAAAAAAW
jgi:hypothetical protein